MRIGGSVGSDNPFPLSRCPLDIANLPWLLFPLLIIYRVGRRDHPFTQPVSIPAVAAAYSSANAVQ
jgi:hypothetical protein